MTITEKDYPSQSLRLIRALYFTNKFSLFDYLMEKSASAVSKNNCSSSHTVPSYPQSLLFKPYFLRKSSMSHSIKPYPSFPWRSLVLVLSVGITLNFLGSSEALAIGEVDLKDQITAVDATTKGIAHVGLWAVVVLTGIIGVYKQSVPMIGTTAVGALVISKLSTWITETFTLTI